MAARGLFSSADDLQRDQLTYPDGYQTEHDGQCDIQRRVAPFPVGEESNSLKSKGRKRRKAAKKSDHYGLANRLMHQKATVRQRIALNASQRRSEFRSNWPI
jgi:hypothetical protein